MPGRASQIDVEIVREAAQILGLGTSLGELEARVAALEAQVALLAGVLAAKAWVAFDGRGPTILAGPNVAQVARNGGPGLYRVTFETAFADDSYAAVFGALPAPPAKGAFEIARTAASLDLDSGGAGDSARVSVAIFARAPQL